MSVVLSKIHDGIQFLSQYPKIGRFIGTLLGLLEVPILDFIYFLDKYITPGSYQKSMKMFSIFYGSKVIPLGVKIEGTPTIAPTEEIMGIIRRMPAVSIGYCYCRAKEKNCDNPIWTCIHIGTAKHLDELGRKIPLKSSTIEEVEQLLLKSDKLGLVHQLLTAPITKEEILLGKALAAAVPSIVISWIAEIIYIISTDIILYNIMGRIILPNLFAAIMFIFLMPTQTILSTLLMTSFSSKARGSREALQKSGFFAIPIIFLVSALVFLPLLVHPALTLASEVILVLLMFIILRRATKNFNRNKLLSVGS